MSENSRSSRPTMKMCRFIGVSNPPCHGSPRWKLETDEGSVFVTCDVHLAEGIRQSGLPAHISAPKFAQDIIPVRLSNADEIVIPPSSKLPSIT